MLKVSPEVLSDSPRQEQSSVQEHTSASDVTAPEPAQTSSFAVGHVPLSQDTRAKSTYHGNVSRFTPEYHHTHFAHVAASEPSTSTARTTIGTESTSSDKLTALPGPIVSSTQTNRIRHHTIPSSSTPALHDLPLTTATTAIESRALPSPSNRPNVVTGAPDTQGFTPPNKSKASTPQRVSFEGAPRTFATINYSPRSLQQTPVHPLIQHQSVFAPSLRGGQAESSPVSASSRVKRSSDPPKPSPSLFRPAVSVNPNTSPHKANVDPPRSRASSRATSPIRLFPWPVLHRGTPPRRNYEEAEPPFVPVDPFTRRPRRFSLLHSPDIERVFIDPTCEESLFCCFPALSCDPKDRFRAILNSSRFFLADTIPRQVYLHLLLRLPSLYFSRIARLFEDAEVSQPDIERMIQICAPLPRLRGNRPLSSPIPMTVHPHPEPVLPFPEDWTPDNSSPALVRFRDSWGVFIDSLLREWKTFNLVSALLLSAILSMFQNQEMANDPAVRTTALISLTCALMSLSYGCVYIVRFGTMRSMYKAVRWAQETQRTTTFILWNVWVLLAMPGVWLAWSMIFFIISILTFVWRSDSTTDPATLSPLSPSAALGPRIAVSAFFLLGLVYFTAIVRTLQSYGQPRAHRTDQRDQGPAERDGNERGRTRKREPLNGESSGSGGGGASSSGKGGSGKDTGDQQDDDDYNRQKEHRTFPHTYDADGTQAGGLSAVMGLGLRGLDSFARPFLASSQEEQTEDGKH